MLAPYMNTTCPLLEVLHAGSSEKFDDETRASQHLSSLSADIRLDLHGVLDILPVDLPLDPSSVCCISFVGPKAYEAAKQDIQARIGSGQIRFGVLVFKRGVGKDRFTFTEAGSKAWVNKQIPWSRRCLFVDDSTDHLRSTAFLMGSEGVACRLFNTGIPRQLLDIVSKWRQS
jgi:hypothetical protein